MTRVREEKGTGESGTPAQAAGRGSFAMPLHGAGATSPLLCLCGPHLPSSTLYVQWEPQHIVRGRNKPFPPRRTGAAVWL